MHDISRRLFRVWQRNCTVYMRTWKINFLPPLFEPALYLLAFGAGLGVMVGTVMYQGKPYDYSAFIAPAIVSITIMQNSFFETTYASYVRMYYQKTFEAILSTPLSLGDVIAGEIVWGATKSVVAATLMTVVLTPFGLVDYPSGLTLPLAAALGGMAFGSIGMFFTGITPSIEVFNLPIFLFVTPMFLFSGTFFPVENLPGWAQLVAWGSPLTHLVMLVRAGFGMGWTTLQWVNVTYLTLFTVVFFPLGVAKMRKRLIR